MPSKPFSGKPPTYEEIAAADTAEVEDVTDALYQDIHEDFLTEVSTIQGLITRLRGNIASLAKLRARRYSLFLEPEPASASDNEGDAPSANIDDVVQRIALLISEIDAHLSAFGTSPSASVMQATRSQAALLRLRFLEALRAYHTVERDARMRLRARIARQFRVVHPDATLNDVRKAAEGRPARELLRADLGKSRRYGEGRKALREVQERQDELAQLERSLEELNALIERISAAVERDEAAAGSSGVRRSMAPLPREMKNESETALVSGETVSKPRRVVRRRTCLFILALILAGIIGIIIVAAVVALHIVGQSH